MVRNLEELIILSKKKKKKTLSVAVAQDREVILAVVQAVNLGIVDAILVGNEEEIVKIADKEKISLANIEIVNEINTSDAVSKAVKLVSSGQADYIMKGMISSSDILKAVLNREVGLRGDGLLSHVMIYDIPNYQKLIFLTDGGLIPYPDINQKVGIVKNVVKVAHSLNIKKPKIASICAAEFVNLSMQATVDAATLTLMNRRGQITGCTIEGPLGLDSAVSKEAAVHKGLLSEVTGDADVLLVPNIESGNFLGKTLTYFAGAENAGVVIGAKCPIVLVSRSNSAKSKLYSIALGALI